MPNSKKIITFSLPKGIYILQLEKAHIFLAILFNFGPLIVLLAARLLSLVDDGLYFGILFFLCVIYILILGGSWELLRRPFDSLLWRFQNHFALKWVLENLRCPNCHGKLYTPKKSKVHPFYRCTIYDYILKCSSCRNKYKIDPSGWKENKWHLIQISH